MKWFSRLKFSLSIRPFQNILLEERSQWILWLPVGVGIGIVLYFHLSFEPKMGTGPLFCLVCMILLFLFHKKIEAFLLLSLLLSLAVGFTAAQLRTYSLSTYMIQAPLSVYRMKGTIFQIEVRPASVRVTLKGVEIPESSFPAPIHAIRLTFRGKMAQHIIHFYPGQKIEVNGKLLPPNEPIAPGTYNFRKKAYFEGISAVGYATSVPVHIQNVSSGFALKLAAFRHYLTTLLHTKIKGEEGAIAASLVTGERAAIPEPIRQAFADAGLAHILAISGLHLSIIAGLAFLLIRRGLTLIPYFALHYPNLSFV